MMQARRLRRPGRIGEIGTRTGRDLLLDQPDHPVVIATAPVDDAEAVAVTIVEEIKVVTDEFHLQQGLVDRHRRSRVHLLAHHQRAVAFHLDRHELALRLHLVEVSPAGLIVHLAGPRPGHAVAVEPRLSRRHGQLKLAESTRKHWRHACQHIRRPHRNVVTVLDLAPVGGPAESGFEFREGQVERGVPVVRRRLGPDRGTTGPDRQFDAFAVIRLPWVTFLGNLHVDPHRLGVQLLEPGQLGGGVLTETFRDSEVASPDDDFHLDPHSVDFALSSRGAALARPTWSSTPHSPAEGFAASIATTALLPVRETRYLPARQDLLLSRTVISRQEVALRGPFCLRLASACPAWRPRREPRPAQPRARASAMSER